MSYSLEPMIVAPQPPVSSVAAARTSAAEVSLVDHQLELLMAERRAYVTRIHSLAGKANDEEIDGYIRMIANINVTLTHLAQHGLRQAS